MTAAQNPSSPPGTLVVAGVEGQAAQRLNGDYVLMEQVSSMGKPVWGKSPPNGLQIACARFGPRQSEYWCVRETASNKKKASNKMWAPAKGAFPDDVASDWTVADKGDTRVQPGVFVKVGAPQHPHEVGGAGAGADSRERTSREDALRRELKELRRDLRARTALVDSLKEEAATLREEVQGSRAELAETEGRLSSAEAEVQGSRAELAETEGRLRSAEAELKEARHELKAVTSSEVRCCREIDGLRGSLSTRTAQRNELRAEVDRLQVAADAAQAEVADAEGRLHSSQAALEEARGELADAREQLSKALACREQSSSWCAAGAQWEYEHHGDWHGFGLEANHLLLQAYMRFLTKPTASSAEVNSGGVLRQVEFSSMHQVNKDTGVLRRVRLKLNVPTSWGGPCRLLAAGQDHRQVERDQSVVAAIAALMRATAHGRSRAHPGSTCCDMANLRLLRVYRVENVDLWLRYVGHARHLGTSVSLSQHACGHLSAASAAVPHSTLGGWEGWMHARRLSSAYPLNRPLNEAWLFHGTADEAAQRITSSGFDARVANEGGLYGWGTYFSSQSCKSHQYARPNADEVHTMILSRVLLGCPHYVTTACPDLKRPPERQDAPALRHDSVIANPGIVISPATPTAAARVQAHQEMVIYENALHAYPSYVIQYTV